MFKPNYEDHDDGDDDDVDGGDDSFAVIVTLLN